MGDRQPEQHVFVDAQELDGEAEQAGEQQVEAEHAAVGHAGRAQAREQHRQPEERDGFVELRRVDGDGGRREPAGNATAQGSVLGCP